MKKQRTVKAPVVLEGVGLQTGENVTAVLKPASVNSGVSFVRTDLPNSPVLNINSIGLDSGSVPGRRTTLVQGEARVQTTEHLLAALSGLSIDNIVIELNGPELPGLDGSAIGFVKAIKKSGLVEQDAPKNVLCIKDPVWCEEGGSFIAIFPGEDLKISYTLSYEDQSIGTQFLSITIDEKAFEKELAGARTFCLKKEAEALLKMGFGKGANHENTLVMDKDGPIKNKLRFRDEPVRHKILDLVGDLYLAGMQIYGHVVAYKSGHALNMKLVKKLKGE